jgi:hypothetical protein
MPSSGRTARDRATSDPSVVLGNKSSVVVGEGKDSVPLRA